MIRLAGLSPPQLPFEERRPGQQSLLAGFPSENLELLF